LTIPVNDAIIGHYCIPYSELRLFKNKGLTMAEIAEETNKYE